MAPELINVCERPIDFIVNKPKMCITTFDDNGRIECNFPPLYLKMPKRNLALHEIHFNSTTTIIWTTKNSPFLFVSVFYNKDRIPQLFRGIAK